MNSAPAETVTNFTNTILHIPPLCSQCHVFRRWTVPPRLMKSIEPPCTAFLIMNLSLTDIVINWQHSNVFCWLPILHVELYVRSFDAFPASNLNFPPTNYYFHERQSRRRTRLSSVDVKFMICRFFELLMCCCFHQLTQIYTLLINDDAEKCCWDFFFSPQKFN